MIPFGNSTFAIIFLVLIVLFWLFFFVLCRRIISGILFFCFGVCLSSFSGRYYRPLFPLAFIKSSFPRPSRDHYGHLRPVPFRFLSSFFLAVPPDAIRLFRVTGWRGDTLFLNFTHVCVCILREGCHPVTLSPSPKEKFWSFSRPKYLHCSRNRRIFITFRDLSLAYIKKKLYLCSGNIKWFTNWTFFVWLLNIFG